MEVDDQNLRVGIEAMSPAGFVRSIIITSVIITVAVGSVGAQGSEVEEAGLQSTLKGRGKRRADTEHQRLQRFEHSHLVGRRLIERGQVGGTQLGKVLVEAKAQRPNFQSGSVP